MAITWQGWMRYLGGGDLFNADRGVQFAGPQRAYSNAGITVTDDAAITVSAIFRCIRFLSEVGALLPIVPYERLPDGDRKELPASHWLSRLIRRPNEVMSGDQWSEAMYAQQAGWGNAYSQIVRNAAGQPVELWPYKVDRMKVERLPDLTVRYTYPDPQGTQRVLEKGRVAHMRGFTIDGVMGISPLSQARNAAGIALQAETYAGSFFAHGGRPAGVMTSEKLLNEPQRKQIREQYGSMADATTGERMWLLEGGLKYQALTVNPDDMQLILTRGFQVAEIARFFGVPLFLLFETEKSTSWGSGIEQQNNALKTYTLAPLAQDMQNLWNHQIIPLDQQDKLFVEVDLEALQTADLAALLTFYGGMADKGIMHRNEVRKKMKLAKSPDKNADKLTVQSAMTTLENVGEEQRQPPSLQPAPSSEPAAKALPLILDLDDIRGTLAKTVGTVESLARSVNQAIDHSARNVRTVETAMNELADQVRERVIPKPEIRNRLIIRGDDGKISGLEYTYDDGRIERLSVQQLSDGNIQIRQETDDGD